MISHFSSRESWPINLPSRLLWLHPPASTTQFQASLPFARSLLQSQVASFQFLDPSNASFCLRIYAYAVPLYQKCFSRAYYLGDCFSSFRSWPRCHLFIEAIPDHLGGLKMAVKSVLLPPPPLPWKVEFISIALESELSPIVALISQMQQKWCCASSGPGL